MHNLFQTFKPKNNFSSHNALFQLFWKLFWGSTNTDNENKFSWSLFRAKKAMFHPWGFWLDLSIGSKHFSFHVSIFLLLGLPSAHQVRKISQNANWKCFLPIENPYQSLSGMKKYQYSTYYLPEPFILCFLMKTPYGTV